jgi:hypothetical protein
MRKSHRHLNGCPKGVRSLGRPRRCWDDTIKMYLKDIVVRMWTYSIWLRVGISGVLL